MSELFKDRIVQDPGAVIITNRDTGETQKAYISRDEGTITQEGTPLNAQNFNKLIRDEDDRDVGVTKTFSAKNYLMDLGTSEALYTAINNLGWTSDVIV